MWLLAIQGNKRGLITGGRPIVSLSTRKCAMNVVRFFCSALHARSRPAQNVSCTDGGDRTEGGREALPGSNGWGYHQQSGLKCTGLRPSP